MGQDSTTMTDRHESERTSQRRAIGVFDSGVGGLTVVRALRAEMPGEDIVYLGDTARVPYGSKSPRTVEKYSLACQRFLLARGVKLVLIACNTASANALPALREVSPVGVIGAVEPGATSAELIVDQVHAGAYKANAVLDRDQNFDESLFPGSGDAVSLPNQDVAVAAGGESTASLSLVVEL